MSLTKSTFISYFVAVFLISSLQNQSVLKLILQHDDIIKNQTGAKDVKRLCARTELPACLCMAGWKSSYKATFCLE